MGTTQIQARLQIFRRFPTRHRDPVVIGAAKNNLKLWPGRYSKLAYTVDFRTPKRSLKPKFMSK